MIGGVVALMVAGASLLAYVSAERELDRQVNEFLVLRSREVESGLDALLVSPLRNSREAEEIFRAGAQAGALTRADASIQLLYNGGNQALVISGTALPVVAADVAIAQQSEPSVTVRNTDERTVDGVRYRILTSSVASGALMVGRSVEDVHTTLDGLRGWLVVISLSGTLAAALVGWLVADRVLRPVSRLAAATQQVAETRRFDADLRVETGDELGALATSFNTMLSALRASREQQHRLIRDANHELRTPLTSLRTNVDVLRLRAGLLDAQERASIIDEMDAEIRELTELVSELVEFATDSSSLDREDFVELDLVELAGQVAERTVRRTGRPVVVEGPDTHVVLGDPTGLERALGNLVGNAVKFSPGSSQIDICVGDHRVEVRDRGPGIPDGDHGRIFDRFYRSDGTRTLPGSGLGLAIVADVAAAHGGSTIARDREGGGSIVGFTLGADFVTD